MDLTPFNMNSASSHSSVLIWSSRRGGARTLMRDTITSVLRRFETRIVTYNDSLDGVYGFTLEYLSELLDDDYKLKIFCTNGFIEERGYHVSKFDIVFLPKTLGWSGVLWKTCFQGREKELIPSFEMFTETLAKYQNEHKALVLFNGKLFYHEMLDFIE